MARRKRREGQETGLRVIGGGLRGRRLETPRGQILRPMRDMVREALFNMLGPLEPEERVLDLFAGSGSLGIEALSRGAGQAVFVERAEVCARTVEANLRALGLAERGAVVRHDLGHGVALLKARGPFHLVLIHPPFVLLRQAPPPGEPELLGLLGELAATPGLLAAGATLAFETPRECYPTPEPFQGVGLELVLRREYGTTALFLTRLVSDLESG